MKRCFRAAAAELLLQSCSSVASGAAAERSCRLTVADHLELLQSCLLMRLVMMIRVILLEYIAEMNNTETSPNHHS